MKKESGVTLITLVASIIILIIIAGISIYNSLDMYNRMKYENFIVQLEELQAAVDKMCEKYKTGGYTSYIDSINGFFIKKYNKIPETLAVAENKEKADKIINKYFGGKSDFHDGFVFYFSADEIEEYFNINGIDFDVVIDFSTRYVYSVDGCKDYEKNGTIVYSLIDVKTLTVLQEDTNNTASSASGIIFTQKYLQSGDTKMCEITLTLDYESEGNKYDIKKAYYSKNDTTKWSDVELLGDCKYTSDKVSFYIYTPGKYYFKIEDTSGKMITNINDGVSPVETTITF